MSIRKTKYRCPSIEGYCSHTSVRAGEKLDLCQHESGRAVYAFDLSSRLLRRPWRAADDDSALLPAPAQPDPETGPERLRDCCWEPATTLTIPADWPSGVYVGKLTEQREKLESYVIFIVRDDRPCDLLVQASDTTWAAYNRWPSQWSLYDNGKKVWYWGPGVRVSWNRPYGRYCQPQINASPLSLGSGEFLLWEFPLTYWLEQNGYDVSYISNVDTHADPAALLRVRGFLSVGHDEYWSPEMFRNMQSAIAAGLNVGFLSGNTCCGVIDFGSRDEIPNRTLSRIGQYGPIQEATAKSFPELLDLKHNGPNEATLIGARSTFPVTGGADWICANDKHWLFADTGMKNGDGIPGLVGWEWHGDPANIPGLDIVARGEVFSRNTKGTYTATVYPGPKDNVVFNAATIWWSDGLSAPPGHVHPTAYGAKPRGPDRACRR